jgi:hypothetical protein
MSAIVESAAPPVTASIDQPSVKTAEEIDKAPVSSAKVSVNYIECSIEDLIQYSDDEIATLNKEAIVKFNVKPKSARAYLISKKMIQV